MITTILFLILIILCLMEVDGNFFKSIAKDPYYLSLSGVIMVCLVLMIVRYVYLVKQTE